MHTVLVTGGAGFIGSHFLHVLQQCDEVTRYINCDALTYAGRRERVAALETDPRYRFVQADVCDLQAMQSLFARYDIDTVVHFAAQSHVDRSIADPQTFVRTNVMGTATLLEAARHAWAEGPHGYRQGVRFLHISTDEVYGSLQTGRFTENSPLAPRNPYAASKASAELWVQAYHTTYGLPTLIARCCNQFGSHQHPEKFIPHMVACAMANRPLPVYGDGLQVREWMAVDEGCRALQTLLARGALGEVYNVGSGCERTNLWMAEQIVDFLHQTWDASIDRDRIAHVNDRAGHDRRYAVDTSKIQALGWQPSMDASAFLHALQQTVQWYVTHPKALEY